MQPGLTTAQTAARSTCRPRRVRCSRRSPPRSATFPACCCATRPRARSPRRSSGHRALADDRSTRYRIDGEIARGGMGAVLKGRDPDLGRDVAIKVLREDLRDNGDLVRRFVEEAQIGGQLQHPGVVPIYELGTFADRRPYLQHEAGEGANAGRPARGPIGAGRRPAPLPVDLRGHLRRRWPTPTPAA